MPYPICCHNNKHRFVSHAAAEGVAAGTTTTRINQTSNAAKGGRGSVGVGSRICYFFASFISFLFDYFFFSSYWAWVKQQQQQRSTFDGTRRGVNTNTTLTHTNKQTNRNWQRHPHIHTPTHTCAHIELCSALRLLCSSALPTVCRGC